jgi:hypothetical protein
MSARHLTPRKPPLITWIAYKVQGAKAAMLGEVKAADMEAAIAAAAVEFRVPASRILVRPTD